LQDIVDLVLVLGIDLVVFVEHKSFQLLHYSFQMQLISHFSLCLVFILFGVFTGLHLEEFLIELGKRLVDLNA